MSVLNIYVLIIMTSLDLVKMVTANFLGVVVLLEMIVSGFGFRANSMSMNYYMMSCPFAEPIVKNTVMRALQADPTLAAALLRMHFHDCFIEVLSLSLSLSLLTYFALGKILILL